MAESATKKKGAHDAIGWVAVGGGFVAGSTSAPWVMVQDRQLTPWQYHPAPAALAVVLGVVLLSFGILGYCDLSIKAAAWVGIIIGALVLLDAAGFAQTTSGAHLAPSTYLGSLGAAGPIVHLDYGILFYGAGGLAALLGGIASLSFLSRD